MIGAGGRGIDRSDAYDHVFGYTIVNDVTARDLQSLHKPWLIGKSLDSFGLMGPWLVTADEVDPANLNTRCWVNDELRQDANTADLIFDIPILIETLSARITPSRATSSRPARRRVRPRLRSPRFLRPGDRVTVEIDGLGRLVNDVR